MTYNVYVRRLPIDEEDGYEEKKFDDFDGYKLYAIMSSPGNIDKITGRMHSRANVLNISVKKIMVNNNAYFTFFSHMLKINNILYDPFTFIPNTVYKDDPNKPEILHRAKVPGGPEFMVATRTLTEYTEITQQPVLDESEKECEQPDYTEEDIRYYEDLPYINKLKDHLNANGCILAIGKNDLEFKATNEDHTYIVMVFTKLPYQEVNRLFSELMDKIYIELMNQERGELKIVFKNYFDFNVNKRTSITECLFKSENPEVDLEMITCLLYKCYDWYEGRGPLPQNKFYTCSGSSKVIDGVHTHTIKIYEGLCYDKTFNEYHTIVLQDYLIMRNMYKALREFSDYTTLIFHLPFIQNQTIRKNDGVYSVFFTIADDDEVVTRFTRICKAINEYDPEFSFNFSTVPKFVINRIKEGPLRSIRIDVVNNKENGFIRCEETNCHDVNEED